MQILTLFIKWIKEALFPLKCLVCAKEGNVLCRNHYHYEPASNIEIKTASALDECISVTNYHSISAKALIKSLKFNRHKPAAKLIAEGFNQTINWNAYKGATLVAVPLHWRRKHWRGFNQCEVIARHLKLPTNIKINLTAFKRVRFTGQQARLNKTERSKNLLNAFSWNQNHAVPHTVLLLDDVATTGNTLEAAAEALKSAGVKFVVGIVFARQLESN
ncbi:ComF family protein [bacterium]|nr:ComF family protein [bacterium]NCQ54993.1 ComF family protein [Candidatus Parcubacteria bacterium]NCS67037.1 ComF family protein [Candidatus Peregrinibacteria bacterium]NCS95983.1 ComF family protein [bacterium]